MTKLNQPDLVRPKVNKILKATLLFILVNIGFSVFLTYDFYTQGASEVCSVGGTLGCGGIAQTEYALLFGIPHALVGIIFYAIIFIGIGGVILRVPFYKIFKFLRPQIILDLSRETSYVAALYAFYLSYSEISILKVYSMPYLTQQLLIFVILGLQIWANIVISGGKKETQVCEFC